MMEFKTQLFESEAIRLTQIDFDQDPEVESRWTHDSAFMRLLELGPARPLSPEQVKKQYEALEKRVDEDKDLFHFRIRPRREDRLVGLAVIESVEWTNGNGFIKLGIGSPEDRRRGWGRQALSLLLRYAFAELNLFRVSAVVQEYNQAAIHLLGRFGFVEEVRRRQALHRDGRRWDLLVFGLLQSEWQGGGEAG
jgi:RimJ/RimL family protein N-acetyltransferase